MAGKNIAPGLKSNAVRNSTGGAERAPRAAMRGQSGTEFLLMFAVGLAFVTGAFVIGSVYSQESLGAAQAQDAVNRLSQGADYVYTLGPNSKEYIDVYFPRELSSVNASGKRLLFKLDGSGGGTVDFFANTKAELIDAMPKTWGQQKILVQYLPSGKVLLGEAGLACSPSYINGANNTAYDVTITNVLDTQISGISAVLEGSITQTATAIETPPDTELDPGESTTAVVRFNTGGAPSGTYGGDLLVTSGNGTCVTSLTLQVGGASSCHALCRSAGYAQGECRADASACQANNEDNNNPSFNSACAPQVCCCGPSTDTLGPIVTNYTVSNANITLNTTINATCDDTLTGNHNVVEGVACKGLFSGSTCIGTAYQMIPVSALNTVRNFTVDVGPLPGGQNCIPVKCKDSLGNWPALPGGSCFVVTSPDTQGPFIATMASTSVANLAFTAVNVTGIALEMPVIGSNATVAGCYVKVNPTGPMPGLGSCPSWSSATPTSPSTYSTSRTQNFKAELGTLGTGKVHKVCAYCKDSIGNCGEAYFETNTSTYCLSIGVPTPDVIIAIEDAPSMYSQYITIVSDNSLVWTKNQTPTLVKSLTFNQLAGTGRIGLNLTLSGGAGQTCRTKYDIKVGGSTIPNGTSTVALTCSGSPCSAPFNILNSTNLGTFPTPFILDLYLNISGGGACNVSNTAFYFEQTRMNAAKDAAKGFVDITDNNSLVGLITYAGGSTGCLVNGNHPRLMGETPVNNKTAIKNDIDSISGTCGGGGAGGIKIQNALTSSTSILSEILAYGRNGSARAGIVLADAPGSASDTYTSATICRNNKIVIYTIGFASADQTELENAALLTGGKYYFVPDGATLKSIFKTIGT